jgi:hypothetical protein
VVSWKRLSDAKGESKPFGICEFEDPEVLLRCWRLLNNMPLLGSKLLIKIDSKSQEFIEDWRDFKKSEWLERQKKKGVVIDLDEFMNKERTGDIMEWEKEIIGDKDSIFAEISQIVQEREIVSPPRVSAHRSRRSP